MTIGDIKTILNAEFICGEAMSDNEVHTACSSDLMSDVLAFVKDQAVLLTGLVNTQTIRTAEMMDMVCVVLVRGKKPTEDICKLADERGIAMLCTQHSMFEAAGRLYEKGLRGGEAVK